MMETMTKTVVVQIQETMGQMMTRIMMVMMTQLITVLRSLIPTNKTLTVMG